MVAAAVLALALAAPPATVERAGIVAPLPEGWHVVDQRLTPCTNPLERLTLVGLSGTMLMLQESLDPPRYVARFDPRPRRWRLGGRPQPISCCAPSRRAGWFMNFRDAGRGFYVYVYAETARERGTVLSVLNRLHVAPRRRS
jgi:hypothetical protein